MSLTKHPEHYLRFFARIRSIDLSCPRCGRVQAIHPTTSHRIWDPRTGRFQCMGCYLTLRLGVIAYNSSNGHGSTHPSKDCTMTVREALALRRDLNLWVQTKCVPKDDRNAFLDEGPRKGDGSGGKEPSDIREGSIEKTVELPVLDPEEPEE